MGSHVRPQVLHEDEWWRLVQRVDSPQGMIHVIEREEPGGLLRRRCLHGGLVQNTYDPLTRRSLSHYTGALLGLARAYTSCVERALCIGLGAGLVPRELARGGARVDVVEINPAMAAVAATHFDFDPKAVSLAIQDGREFLASTSRQYDAVILDAFMDGNIPPHLVTVESLRLAKSRLKPEGVLVINAFGETSPAYREGAARLDRTLRCAFASAAVVQHASGQGNVFFVAARRVPLKPIRPPDFSAEHPDLRFGLMLMWQGVRPPDGREGPVSRDADSPRLLSD